MSSTFFIKSSVGSSGTGYLPHLVRFGPNTLTIDLIYDFEHKITSYFLAKRLIGAGLLLSNSQLSLANYLYSIPFFQQRSQSFSSAKTITLVLVFGTLWRITGTLKRGSLFGSIPLRPTYNSIVSLNPYFFAFLSGFLTLILFPSVVQKITLYFLLKQPSSASVPLAQF